MKECAIAAFRRRFGSAPTVLVRAPGRVNLIGEHVDYCEGFVLPMAIDRAVWIALEPQPGDGVTLWSENFAEETHFDLSALQPGGPRWAEYVKGTAHALAATGDTLRGFRGVVAGDVPLGSGLSSSAALEVASVCAFEAAGGFELSGPLQRARVGQQAEHEWIGVRCGIMDQLASAAGEEGKALLIDCRSESWTACALPTGTEVFVLDTGTRRSLGASEYNQRRARVEEAPRLLGVRSLREVAPGVLADSRALLDPETFRLAHHVVSEIARTQDAARACGTADDGEATSGDGVALGQLMNASHESLRLDYRVSAPALDAIVEAAREQPGCLGARMTGAGFGGCAVALVAAEFAEEFAERTLAAYRARLATAAWARDAVSEEPAVLHVRPERGAGREPLG